jgi:biotin transport system ATP-binding protein
MSMIEFEAVSHSYAARRVLSDVTVTLTEQRIGVIGANGSGKSTFARMINGLVHPSAGAVRVDGLDPVRQGREVRAMVSFLFSDPDAQIVMPTVAEDIAFSLRRQRLTRDEVQARVRATLDTVGLSDYAEHPAHALSSGQKQLLAMASILVTDPQVLICDEPTTLLDRRNTRLLLDLLRDLPQQVIVVTHDLAIATECERVLVFAEGRIVADAPGADAVNAYVDMYA